MIKAIFSLGKIYSTSVDAYGLNDKSSFGEKKSSRVEYSPSEIIYLLEESKAELYLNNKKISCEEFIKKIKKSDKDIEAKSIVFRDLRKKGYVLKSALKFGADFRVYDKGQKPGNSHSPWLVWIIKEHEKLDIREFSSKNRIANSTKKKLLIAVIDDESSITYYETSWKRT